MKQFPFKGNFVYVEYITDYLIPHTFYGRCISYSWAKERTTFTIINSVGFKQTFFFFSPLVTNVKRFGKF